MVKTLSSRIDPTSQRHISLSGNATVNDAEIGIPSRFRPVVRTFRSGGDFAETMAGRARRDARRRKMAWQLACLEG